MGVNLHMKIDKRTFDLGRSYRYIDCPGASVDTNLQNLYEKKQYATEQVEKYIIALASHHPTKEEVSELLDEIGDMIAGFADEIENLGRCMTLAEIKAADDAITFEVK